MAHVVGLATSHEVWTTLDHLFSSQSQARILRIRYQLSTLQRGNLSISDYYQRAKTLADTLAAIGQPLQHFEVVSYILGSLDSTYDSLVTSITTRVDPISLEDLFSHLLSHEQRIKRNHATPDIPFPQQMLPLAPLILVDAILNLHNTLSPLIKDHLIMDITIIMVGGVDVMQLMATHVQSVRCARNLAILLSLATIALIIPFKVYLPISLPLLLVLHLSLMLIGIQIRGPPII